MHYIHIILWRENDAPLKLQCTLPLLIDELWAKLSWYVLEFGNPSPPSAAGAVGIRTSTPPNPRSRSLSLFRVFLHVLGGFELEALVANRLTTLLTHATLFRGKTTCPRTAPLIWPPSPAAPGLFVKLVEYTGLSKWWRSIDIENHDLNMRNLLLNRNVMWHCNLSDIDEQKLNNDI